MAEAELTCVAVDQIQTDGEDDVDSNINDDAEVIAIELTLNINTTTASTMPAINQRFAPA